jgi:multiple sugar transport system permease protein
MKKGLDQRVIPWLFVLPTVAFLVGISIYPLLNSLYLTFNEWRLTTGNPPRFVGLKNYLKLIRDDRFWSSLKTTAIFTGSVVSAEMLIGMILALSMSKNTRFRRICRSVMLIPMMITPVVLGLIWKYMYNPENGIINYLLHFLKFKGPIWLGEPKPALPAIMIVDVWQWTPFVFLILLSGLGSLPQDVFEAARVDGANHVQIFRYVTLPLLVPFILIALLIRFIDSFRIFDTIFVLTRGGPANATETLSIYTYKVGLNFFDMGYAATLSYVILVIITLAAQQFLRMERT